MFDEYRTSPAPDRLSLHLYEYWYRPLVSIVSLSQQYPDSYYFWKQQDPYDGSYHVLVLERVVAL
eukprot:scaffold344570_cov23-Prasinocladus_malaysianus.AAC.1